MRKYLLLLCITFLAGPLFAQKQGIKGKVEWISGNQMPGPDRKDTTPMGIEREIYIYESTSLNQVQQDGVFFSGISTKLITKTRSKKDGSFCVKLPPGEYSIFINETKGLFANQFDSKSCIQCVTVKKREFLNITILVNYEASY